MSSLYLTPAISQPSSWQVAWLAIRPHTLTISVAPVLVGSSLAWANGSGLLWLPLLAALCCAVLIQIGTNLHNDAVDCEKGNDQMDRLGPLRVTAAGWVPPNTVRLYALGCFVMAFVLGIYLANQGGWPIVAIGLGSLLSGWAYSGGPYPISYSPLGEVFVLLFFGIFAVGGSVWLQGQTPQLDGLFAGIICGLPAAAVLLVNNTRDLDADLRVGRRTLAAVLGRNKVAHFYASLMLLPYLLLIALLTQGHLGGTFALLSIFSTVANIRYFYATKDPAALNPLLGASARSGLFLALLLTLGLLMETW